jgi:hypothetical protein
MNNYKQIKNIVMLLEAQVDKEPDMQAVTSNLKRLALEHMKNQETIETLERKIARLQDKQEQITIEVYQHLTKIKRKQIKIGNILIWARDVHELVSKGKKTHSYAKMYKALITFIKKEKAIVKAVQKKFDEFVKTNKDAHTKVNPDKYADYIELQFSDKSKNNEAKQTNGEKLNENLASFLQKFGSKLSSFLSSAFEYLSFQADQVEKYAKQVKAELSQNS